MEGHTHEEESMMFAFNDSEQLGSTYGGETEEVEDGGKRDIDIVSGEIVQQIQMDTEEEPATEEKEYQIYTNEEEFDTEQSVTVVVDVVLMNT